MRKASEKRVCRIGITLHRLTGPLLYRAADQLGDIHFFRRRANLFQFALQLLYSGLFLLYLSAVIEDLFRRFCVSVIYLQRFEPAFRIVKILLDLVGSAVPAASAPGKASAALATAVAEAAFTILAVLTFRLCKAPACAGKAAAVHCGAAGAALRRGLIPVMPRRHYSRQCAVVLPAGRLP